MPIITDSGNLVAAEWESGILTIDFQKGGRYEYYDVPQGIFQELLAAPSKNTFLKSEIIGKFEYARV
jgi:KTSC domain